MNVQHEEDVVQREYHRAKPRHLSYAQKAVVVLLLVFGLTKAFACPMVAYSVPTKQLFHDCWICKKCGYENYNGIETCGLCGGCK